MKSHMHRGKDTNTVKRRRVREVEGEMEDREHTGGEGRGEGGRGAGERGSPLTVPGHPQKMGEGVCS